MLNFSDPDRQEQRLPLGVNFSVRDTGLVSCRPLDYKTDELESVVLRLSGPSGARVEHLQNISDWMQLRWGGLTPGWWTVEAEGIDHDGRPSWHAPQVRFRTSDDGVAQVCLNFCRQARDRS